MPPKITHKRDFASPPDYDYEYSRGLSGGAIAGIVIGITITVLLVVGLFWWRNRHRNRHQDWDLDPVVYAPANTNHNTASIPGSEQEGPVNMYAGSTYGKGVVVPGSPPPEYSTEMVSRQGQSMPEMDVGMDRSPLRGVNAMTTGVVPKSDAAELPVTNTKPTAELPP